MTDRYETKRTHDDDEQLDLPEVTGVILEHTASARWFQGGRKKFYRPAVSRPQWGEDKHGGRVVLYRVTALVCLEDCPSAWGFDTREEAAAIVDAYLEGWRDPDAKAPFALQENGSWDWSWPRYEDIEPEPYLAVDDCDWQVRRAEAGNGE